MRRLGLLGFTAPRGSAGAASKIQLGFAWVLAIAAFSLCVSLAHRAAVLEPMRDDSRTFLCATRLAFQGGSPYALDELTTSCRGWTHGNSIVQPFFYPPPFLALAAWTLAFPGYPLAGVAWAWLNALGILVLAWRLSAWSRLSLPLCLLGTSAYYPTLFNQQVGNVNVALTVVLLESVMRISGPWLAIGVLTKLSPVVALPALLARGAWRSLAEFAGTAAVMIGVTLALFGSGGFHSFVNSIFPVLNSGTYPFDVPRLDGQLNHAFSRVLVRLGDDPTHLSPAANGVRWAMMLGMSIAASWRGRDEPAGSLGLLATAGAFGCVMVLCAPIAWDSHLPLVLPALAYAWHALSGHPRGRVALGTMYVLLALPADWWQRLSYVFPEASGVLGAAKMLVMVALYVTCVRPGGAPAAGVA